MICSRLGTHTQQRKTQSQGSGADSSGICSPIGVRQLHEDAVPHTMRNSNINANCNVDNDSIFLKVSFRVPLISIFWVLFNWFFTHFHLLNSHHYVVSPLPLYITYPSQYRFSNFLTFVYSSCPTVFSCHSSVSLIHLNICIAVLSSKLCSVCRGTQIAHTHAYTQTDTPQLVLCTHFSNTTRSCTTIVLICLIINDTSMLFLIVNGNLAVCTRR